MDIDELMAKLRESGFTGFHMWSDRLTDGTVQYMCCLTRSDGGVNRHDPDYDTNLWNYASSPYDAAAALTEKAKRLSALRKVSE